MDFIGVALGNLMRQQLSLFCICAHEC